MRGAPLCPACLWNPSKGAAGRADNRLDSMPSPCVQPALADEKGTAFDYAPTLGANEKKKPSSRGANAHQHCEKERQRPHWPTLGTTHSRVEDRASSTAQDGIRAERTRPCMLRIIRALRSTRPRTGAERGPQISGAGLRLGRHDAAASRSETSAGKCAGSCHRPSSHAARSRAHKPLWPAYRARPRASTR